MYLHAKNDGVGKYKCEEVLARCRELALLPGKAEDAEGDGHEEGPAAELYAREERESAEEYRVLSQGGDADQDQRFNL